MRVPGLHRPSDLGRLSLVAAALVALHGCAVAPGDAELELSLYALVETADGVYFHPPLGPAPTASGVFDATLGERLEVRLEAGVEGGAYDALATFDAASTPRLETRPQHEVYFVNLPAAGYFRNPTLAHRFRVLLDGRELGRSDLSNKVFSVIERNPGLLVGVKVRVETRLPPRVSGLAPATVEAGGPDFVLTVLGANFVGDSVVRVGDLDLATTVVSAGELRATVPAAHLRAAGELVVAVHTPPPGGGTSSSAAVLVVHPAPVLSAVAPSAVTAGGGGLTLNLDGSGFAPAAVVELDGVALETVVVSAAELRATVPAVLLAAAGERAVSVTNPAPGGGTSSARVLLVNHPAAVVTAVEPTGALAGSGPLSVTVRGASFVAGATATFGAVEVPSTFVSSSALVLAVPASLLAVGGERAVVVSNPPPSLGAAGGATFTVSNPAPSLSALSPASGVLGGASFALTIDGAGFLPGALAGFGGASLPTTFVSSSRVVGIVGAASLILPGTAEVTVTNPAPTTGASLPLGFRVAGLPGAPTQVVGVPGDRLVTLSWSAPGDDGGAAISGYVLTPSSGAPIVVSSADTTYTVAGLSNGVAQTFTVAATNAAGTGPASVASAPVSPRTVPGAPANVTVVAAYGQAVLSWSAPADNGGATITSYLITPSSGAPIVTPTAATTYTLNGLTNGTAYVFTVAATNEAGTGPASQGSAPTTPSGASCATILRTGNSTGDGLYWVDADGPGPAPSEQVYCDMTTDGGGWTLILRDNWGSALVTAGITTLPAASSVGVASGNLDYVGPYALRGDYLYFCRSCTGDNKFISTQSMPFDAAQAVVQSGTYDRPLATLAGYPVRADADGTHRLNYFSAQTQPSCGAVASSRDNGSNCWNNFFGSSYWENLPGGNAVVASAAGHIAELYVRERADGSTPSRAAKSCRELRQNGVIADGTYYIDPDGASGAPALQARCDMTTDGGGFTLVLRDAWDDASVPPGLAALPAENSAGASGGAGDYVGPWASLTGDYLYVCASCAGDNKFISRQSVALSNTAAAVQAGLYEQPLRTTVGAVVRADADLGRRLNYLAASGSAADGAVATRRDNGAGAYNNFFGTTYRENLPGGGANVSNAPGHVAELWVRERATGTSARLAGRSCRDLRQLGVATDGLYFVDTDGFGTGASPVVHSCDMTTAGGGWTLALRDNWDDTTVSRGRTALPAEQSYGLPSGSGDYVGPWQTTGNYLYFCRSCSGDNKFISHQGTRVDGTNTAVQGGSYDQPLLTTSGATVRADQDVAHRLNYLSAPGTTGCGAVATARDNGSNCWNNFFGTNFWENMPGGNAFLSNASGHIAELFVRDRVGVEALLHLDSAAADPRGNAWTAGSGLVWSTSTARVGAASARFPAANSYLVGPPINLIGDFTLELWIHPTAGVASSSNWIPIIHQWLQVGGRGGWGLSLNYGNYPSFAFGPYSENGGLLSSTVAVPINAWSHVAVTRAGSTWRIFVNGVESASATYGAAGRNLSVNTTVGDYYSPSSVIGAIYGATQFRGYMDELRVTLGVARYTSNFAPQETPFGDNQ